MFGGKDSTSFSGNGGFLSALEKGYNIVRESNDKAREHNSSFFGMLRKEEVDENFEIALCVGRSLLDEE